MNIAQVEKTMSIVVNNWRMDPSLNALIHCETGEARRLGEYHFLLLETLAKNADNVLSRTYLMAEVWKNRIVGGNSLPTAIHALRVAIDDDGKQQEIIRTIPKKGYLFNKQYLTIEYVDAPHENPVLPEEKDEVAPVATPLASAEDTQRPALAENKVTGEQASSVEERSPTVRKTRHRNVAFVLAGVVGIALLLLSVMNPFQAPTTLSAPDAPLLVKETLANTSNIEIFHLYTSTPNKKAVSLLAQHTSPAMQRINALLLARNAKLTLYYKFSLSKFTLDMVTENPCSNNRQLTLNFENWQNKDNEMNSVMYQEVEKMLNEMPECK